METIQLIGILLVFFIMVGLMMARKLPTIIALPVMAIAISFIAGVTFMSSDPEKFTIVKDVLEAGSMRMSTAISGLVFGAIFGKVLSKKLLSWLVTKHCQ